MAREKWDEEDSDSSTPASSPPLVARRGKFDDEEQDGDVLESWDADDSDAEREKAKKAAEAKAKADAEAKAKHKSRKQRIQAHNQRRKEEAEAEAETSSEEEEDETEKRARLRREEKGADMSHAEDLFGDLSMGNRNRAAGSGGKAVVSVSDPSDPTNAVDLSAMPLFNPQTKNQFAHLREVLEPLLGNNAKKAQYVLFMQEFTKNLCKELPSDQIKKIASSLTTLSNEKMKEEKAAEKGGKKSKAKNKVALVASRNISNKADTSVYDEDGLDDGDFM